MTLVDSTVWSLALRRNPDSLNVHEQAIVHDWKELADARRALLVGIIRQEVLCGISSNERFERLRARLSNMPMLHTTIKEHDLAATLFNRCRSKGIAVSASDILICASARNHGLPVFTTDKDFERIAALVDIELWKVTAVH